MVPILHFLNWASLVAWMVKILPAMQETQVQSLGWKDPLEKEMATHSSILAWKIPWTEEPGRLQPWGHKELDTTEQLTQTSLLLFHIVVPLPVSINWPDSSNMSGVYFSDLGTYRSPGILLNEDFNLGGLWWDLRVCIFNRFPGNTDLCWSWTTRS